VRNDPARSVVDRSHQAHDVPNLFLVHGSSFVTDGRGQPTCTTQALAYRAGAEITRLAREARSGGRGAPASTFDRAEEYHQRYPEKPGLARCHLP
jgi:choline dehydrogenase-like flavoprotein